MEVLHFMFGIFGNATALFLFLSPIVTFQRIIRNKSTEEFSGVPYNMTLLNCLLSAWYALATFHLSWVNSDSFASSVIVQATKRHLSVINFKEDVDFSENYRYGLPFVSPNNMLVWTINGTGAAIEAVYVLVFLVYAPRKTRARMAGLFTLVLSVFAVIALVSILALHGGSRKIFCGFAATIFSICMYASPLSAMRLVIRTKSVEYMPFLLSLFVFLCGTSWFVYGLLGHDPFIAVPNGCGCFLGAIQLILYSVYHRRIDSDDDSGGASVELGTGKAHHKGEWRPNHSSDEHV